MRLLGAFARGLTLLATPARICSSGGLSEVSAEPYDGCWEWRCPLPISLNPRLHSRRSRHAIPAFEMLLSGATGNGCEAISYSYGYLPRVNVYKVPICSV